MKRPRKMPIWIACPDCDGRGRTFRTKENPDIEACAWCKGRCYIERSNTRKVMDTFEHSIHALKDFNKSYWLMLVDSLVGHINKLENNRFQLVNQLDKEQKKNEVTGTNRPKGDKNKAGNN